MVGTENFRHAATPSWRHGRHQCSGMSDPTVDHCGLLISSQYHPISDLPSFFLHPCNTQDALSNLKPSESLTPEEYLILWLGLIGSAVGLHLPSKLVSA